MEILTATTWSPYLAGAGIGVLVWFAFLFSGRPIGCSSAFSRTTGMIHCFFCGNKTRESEYYKLVPPSIDWQWMLVCGIIIGAFISSILSGSFYISIVPPTFADAFGDNPVLRIITALIGGIFMGLGARWAWGCTSGHGISGLSQLSLASLAAVACFFAGGIGSAMLLYALA